MTASTAQTAPEIFGTQFREATEGKPANGSECAVCGRRCSKTRPVRHVALSTRTGEALPLSEADGPESQGCFPIGSTCAKRFPAGYLTEPMIIDFP